MLFTGEKTVCIFMPTTVHGYNTCYQPPHWHHSLVCRSWAHYVFTPDCCFGLVKRLYPEDGSKDIAEVSAQNIYIPTVYIAGTFQGTKYLWFLWLKLWPRMKQPWLALPAVQSATTKNIIYEISKYCWTTNILSPRDYRIYGIYVDFKPFW